MLHSHLPREWRHWRSVTRRPPPCTPDRSPASPSLLWVALPFLVAVHCWLLSLSLFTRAYCHHNTPQATLRLLRPGDAVIASEDIYGGMHRLLKHNTEHSGLTVKFVPTWDLEEVERVLEETPRTRMLCTSTIAAYSHATLCSTRVATIAA